MDLLSQTHPAVAPPRHVTSAVERRLRRARRAGGVSRRVERVEVAMDAVDALEWLRLQPARSKFYWHGRETPSAHAYVGVADRVGGDFDATLDLLEVRAAALPANARYVGGTRFVPGVAAPEWTAFEGAAFTLPRFELVVTEGAATLATNLVFPRDARNPERVLGELEALRWPDVHTPDDFPLPEARADVPDFPAWRDGIEAALHAFETSSLEKVVLARRAAYSFDDPLSPYALLQRLEAATPACFHFLVQPEPGLAFVGASPERLFRQAGVRLESEAVAGTRPRGQSAATDAEFRDELMLSDKDRREHGYVREDIKRVLTPLCEELDLDTEVSDLALARGRHLYSGLRATLKPDVSAVKILRALHPTPAVGGTPTPDALAMIGETEPFDRGWYAGPVGWVGADAAEFAVGIRSGLVRQHEGGSTLALYSGAGIVRGSEAGAEWREIEQKIGNFARVLGLDT